MNEQLKKTFSIEEFVIIPNEQEQTFQEYFSEQLEMSTIYFIHFLKKVKASFRKIPTTYHKQLPPQKKKTEQSMILFQQPIQKPIGNIISRQCIILIKRACSKISFIPFSVQLSFIGFLLQIPYVNYFIVFTLLRWI